MLYYAEGQIFYCIRYDRGPQYRYVLQLFCPFFPQKLYLLLKGSFALGIIFKKFNNIVVGARRGSPLAVGYGPEENYLGSDSYALKSMTNKITYLDDGDVCVLTNNKIDFYNSKNKKINKEILILSNDKNIAEKGEYKDFMSKEINEQNITAKTCIKEYVDQLRKDINLYNFPINPKDIQKIVLIGCGTAYHSCITAKYWFEKIARVPVEVDIASEFRYREMVMPEGGLAVFISQSGETADTLAALRYCRQQGQKILSIVNVPESTIARESDAVLPTYAGPEIGVASTKAFTTQLTVLATLAIVLARARGAIEVERESELVEALIELPARVADVLNHDERLKELAAELAAAQDVLFLGRGTSYPIALEGALKLKEISYIHAEGYAAGEMKHGPIALIDDGVPVIVIAPFDSLMEKTFSNMQEVIARGGRVIFLTDEEGARRLGNYATHTIALPQVDPFVAPILHAIPVQLLAYHTAVIKNTDVDQPRNLAKSVTVE